MNGKEERKKAVARVKRLVVKIGSSVITHHKDIIDLKVIESIADDISTLTEGGCEVIIVTSGSIAAGIKKLGFKKRPENIPEKQAVAAAGQSILIRYYEKSFEQRGLKIAQILLTEDGLRSRARYLNARNTLLTLIHYDVIPVINENDTVAVDEIKFGDNDNLSAIVAGLVDADLLVILTDTDGLYDGDPRTNPGAKLIKEVRDFESQTKGASESSSGTGTGGMKTKIEAARRASTFGVPTIIANGEKPGILNALLSGDDVGTLFIPGEERLRGKKRWIAYNLKLSGSLHVDEGAIKALEKGSSLLPSGVTGVEGEFSFGDLVSILDDTGKEFARGLVQFDSSDSGKIKGLKTSEIEKVLGVKEYDEIIHRDDMVLL